VVLALVGAEVASAATYTVTGFTDAPGSCTGGLPDPALRGDPGQRRLDAEHDQPPTMRRPATWTSPPLI